MSQNETTLNQNNIYANQYYSGTQQGLRSFRILKTKKVSTHINQPTYQKLSNQSRALEDNAEAHFNSLKEEDFNFITKRNKSEIISNKNEIVLQKQKQELQKRNTDFFINDSISISMWDSLYDRNQKNQNKNTRFNLQSPDGSKKLTIVNNLMGNTDYSSICQSVKDNNSANKNNQIIQVDICCNRNQFPPGRNFSNGSQKKNKRQKVTNNGSTIKQLRENQCLSNQINTQSMKYQEENIKLNSQNSNTNIDKQKQRVVCFSPPQKRIDFEYDSDETNIENNNNTKITKIETTQSNEGENVSNQKKTQKLKVGIKLRKPNKGLKGDWEGQEETEGDFKSNEKQKQNHKIVKISTMTDLQINQKQQQQNFLNEEEEESSNGRVNNNRRCKSFCDIETLFGNKIISKAQEDNQKMSFSKFSEEKRRMAQTVSDFEVIKPKKKVNIFQQKKKSSTSFHSSNNSNSQNRNKDVNESLSPERRQTSTDFKQILLHKELGLLQIGRDRNSYDAHLKQKAKSIKEKLLKMQSNFSKRSQLAGAIPQLDFQKSYSQLQYQSQMQQQHKLPNQQQKLWLNQQQQQQPNNTQMNVQQKILRNISIFNNSQLLMQKQKQQLSACQSQFQTQESNQKQSNSNLQKQNQQSANSHSLEKGFSSQNEVFSNCSRAISQKPQRKMTGDEATFMSSSCLHSVESGRKMINLGKLKKTQRFNCDENWKKIGGKTRSQVNSFVDFEEIQDDLKYSIKNNKNNNNYCLSSKQDLHIVQQSDSFSSMEKYQYNVQLTNDENEDEEEEEEYDEIYPKTSLMGSKLQV